MIGVSVLLLFCVVVVADRCPSEQDTDWTIELLLPHADCDKFYKCVYGEPIEQACPAGLYFNVELTQCDWKENVYCGNRKDPSQVLDPEPDEDLEAEPLEDKEVEYKEEEEEEDNELDEEEQGVKEEEGNDNLQENEEEQEDYEEESEESELDIELEITPQPEPEPMPEPELPDIEFQENGCPVNPRVHWVIAHETECNLFYFCNWGEKLVRECSDSLHFNRVSQVCDWPENANCFTALNKHVTFRQELQTKR